MFSKSIDLLFFIIFHNNYIMKDKLSSSPRINKLLYQMGIFNNYQVVEHLPRRYDDLSYTGERNLKDKDRVVLL